MYNRDINKRWYNPSPLKGRLIMLKLIKEYKEKKALKAFITDKVERLLDSYKVNMLESEGKLTIIRHDLYSNYIHDYTEQYEVVVIATGSDGTADNKSYVFRSNTPYSNDNNLQQIEDTINDLWDKRAEEKQAKVKDRVLKNIKIFQQNLLDNEVVKMGMDKHLVDITFSETKVSKGWNTNNGWCYPSYHAEFTINVANLRYLSKDNDVIIKRYSIEEEISTIGVDRDAITNMNNMTVLIASYIDGLDKYVTEQERLKKLMN